MAILAREGRGGSAAAVISGRLTMRPDHNSSYAGDCEDTLETARWSELPLANKYALLGATGEAVVLQPEVCWVLANSMPHFIPRSYCIRPEFESSLVS